MAKKNVRLELWVHYDSSTGYVWPQVYPTAKDAALDEKANHPIKKLRMMSDPYFSLGLEGPVSGSFGTEVPVRKQT